MNKNIKALAAELTKDILSNKDFFNPSIIVFDNLKMEQWFKVLWLKGSNNIYMNIKSMRFNTLYENILDLKGKRIANRNVIRDIIIQIVSGEIDKTKYSYVYNEDGNIDANRLYDFSNKLASLYFEYEKDCFEPTDWQLDLYNKVQDYALSKGYTFLGKAIEECSLKEITSNVYIFISRKLSRIEQQIIYKYNNWRYYYA